MFGKTRSMICACISDKVWFAGAKGFPVASVFVLIFPRTEVLHEAVSKSAWCLANSFFSWWAEVHVFYTSTQTKIFITISSIQGFRKFILNLSNLTFNYSSGGSRHAWSSSNHLQPENCSPTIWPRQSSRSEWQTGQETGNPVLSTGKMLFGQSTRAGSPVIKNTHDNSFCHSFLYYDLWLR